MGLKNNLATCLDIEHIFRAPLRNRDLQQPRTARDQKRLTRPSSRVVFQKLANHAAANLNVKFVGQGTAADIRQQIAEAVYENNLPSTWPVLADADWQIL
jgi:hypothetical protein